MEHDTEARRPSPEPRVVHEPTDDEMLNLMQSLPDVGDATGDELAQLLAEQTER
ncbi:hypothetical protein [Streptomyces pseudogriseolus]|uniref:hypothetical protein n=1 Tax=Streptomyces pseudogriseolus TaxID=36817 RepID=UPI003FA26F0D